LPLSPFQCSLIMLGITTVYTVLAGFYGVVLCDLLQCG
jgi:Na+/proline symporter